MQAAAGTRFLSSEGPHILVAYEGEAVAGLLTGVEMNATAGATRESTNVLLSWKF